MPGVSRKTNQFVIESEFQFESAKLVASDSKVYQCQLILMSPKWAATSEAGLATGLAVSEVILDLLGQV